MTLEYKLKLAALNIALDITLKGIKKSPERCARNIIELGNSSFPSCINKHEQDELYKNFLLLCKNDDAKAVKVLFFEKYK